MGAAVTLGCQSGPRLAGLNPFHRAERTTFERPAERIERIQALADQSTGADTPAQQAIVRDLIEPLATESDPLIRQATMETLAEFRTPLAGQALLVGLSDDDPHVRHTCCRLVGERRDRGAIESLERVAAEDASFDVRVAAVESLGLCGAPSERFLSALEDPNPAMQLAGVKAMQKATGQDLGPNVSSYLALARGTTPATDTPTAVASNPKPWWRPF